MKHSASKQSRPPKTRLRQVLHHPMDFTQRIPQLLPKDAWTIVVVGDAKKIKRDLQTIAPVELLKLSF